MPKVCKAFRVLKGIKAPLAVQGRKVCKGWLALLVGKGCREI